MHPRVAPIPAGDVARFAWSALGAFQNVPRTAATLIERHDIPKSQRGNASKQARQIRYCLIQAYEYFAAAKTVSMSTKPLLLYYGTMSLALAEILAKQTGDASLDRARGEHAHHGLDLRVSANPSAIQDFAGSAQALRAAPLLRGHGERFGTFELWHRSAREPPVCGELVELFEGGRTTSWNSLFQAFDVRLPLLADHGVSFLDCVRALPRMHSILDRHEILGSTARAKCSAEVSVDKKTSSYTLIIHPTSDEQLYVRCIENLKFEAAAVNGMLVGSLPTSCILRWSHGIAPGEGIRFHFPIALQEHKDEFSFQTEIFSLNEFGIMYVGLFLLGNYARYFPDQWMVDVEAASSLAQAATEFCEIAAERVPLLALSEISQTWYLRT